MSNMRGPFQHTCLRYVIFVCNSYEFFVSLQKHHSSFNLSCQNMIMRCMLCQNQFYFLLSEAIKELLREMRGNNVMCENVNQVFLHTPSALDMVWGLILACHVMQGINLCMSRQAVRIYLLIHGSCKQFSANCPNKQLGKFSYTSYQATKLPAIKPRVHCTPSSKLQEEFLTDLLGNENA